MRMPGTFRIWTLLSACVLLVPAGPVRVFAQSGGRPNIIFLLSDDQRALIVEGLRTLLSVLQSNAPHPFGVHAAVPQPREPRAQQSAAC